METLQIEKPIQTEYLQTNGTGQTQSDELTLHMKTVQVQESAMPEHLKQEKRVTSPSLNELFQETVERKGEIETVQQHWVSDQELEVEGLSNTTLHSFLLEAEKLGKKITYTKTLTVKISD